MKIEKFNRLHESGTSFNLDEEGLETLSNNSGITPFSAINELIDNAHSANAKNVRINLDKDNKGDFIEIIDDGDGFSLQDFNDNYFTVGKINTNNKQKGNGLFGFGMKTSIHSFRDKENKDKFSYEISSFKKGYEPFKYNSITKKVELLEDGIHYGTRIKIYTNKLDKKFDTVKLIRDLEVIWFPADIDIWVGNKKIQKKDPLYRNLSNNKRKCFEKEFIVKGNIIKCELVILSEKNIIDDGEIIPFDQSRCGCKGETMINSKKNSGFYICFGDRFIEIGNNLDAGGNTDHSSFNGIRLDMKIPREIAGECSNFTKNSISKTLFTNYPDFYKDIREWMYRCKSEVNSDVDNKKNNDFLNKLNNKVKECNKKNSNNKIICEEVKYNEDSENLSYITILDKTDSKVSIRINYHSNNIKCISNSKLNKYNELIINFIPFLLKEGMIQTAKKYIQEELSKLL